MEKNTTTENLFRAFQSTRKRVTSDEDGGMTAYIYLYDQFPKGFADHGSILESVYIEILTGTPTSWSGSRPFDDKEFYGLMLDRGWHEAPSPQLDTLEDLERELFEWLMAEGYKDYMERAGESAGRLNWLSRILAKWQERNGLPNECAWEQAQSLDSHDWRSAWLMRFCEAWERAGEEEN